MFHLSFIPAYRMSRGGFLNAVPSREVRDASSLPAPVSLVTSRSSGTFTPIYDADLELDLRPTSAMLLWTVLNRFWSMRSPLYTPGQDRLIRQTGLSKKTVERALKTLETDRPCRFKCGREHPLVIVRRNGMGHNASISPFTCDLTNAPKRRSPTASSPVVAETTNRPQPELLVDVKRHFDAPPSQSEASECLTVVRQDDALPAEVMRQNDAAINGREKPLLETTGNPRAAVFENKDRDEASRALSRYGVHPDMIVRLVDTYGARTCSRQAAALAFREVFAASTNRAGLLVRAIQSDWEIPQKAERAEASVAACDRIRLATEAERTEEAARQAHAARIAKIARSVRCGEFTEEEALLAIHGRAFDDAVHLGAIQRRIAENQLRAGYVACEDTAGP